MIRLNIVVEGHAEESFANAVLREHLVAHDVLVSARRVSHPRKGGIPGRGGLRRYKELHDDLRRWVLEDKKNDARFTTMVDLHAYPSDSPNFDQAHSLEPYRRVAVLEQGMSESIDDLRFTPYIQLYEFESILLVNRAGWDKYFLGQERAVDRLFEEIAAFPCVELINDQPETAPSKRILKYLPNYEKPAAGSIIALELGLEKIWRACRHFNGWLSKLETLSTL